MDTPYHIEATGPVDYPYAMRASNRDAVVLSNDRVLLQRLCDYLNHVELERFVGAVSVSGPNPPVAGSVRAARNK